MTLKVIRENGIWLKHEGINLKLPEQYENHFEDYIDKEVLFGIRPEDIYDKAFYEEKEGNHEGNVLKAKIEVVEPLGAETLLHAAISDQSFTAKVTPRTEAEAMQEMELVFDMNAMHAFDKETEEAIF
jgi:multiple sugar transport system ATP-binding protein